MADFTQTDLVRFLITWAVTAIFIHFAAKIVLDRASFGTALLVALIGTLLAALVYFLIANGTLAIVLAIATWGLVCALFYRTGWLKALVVGLVAWVLYFVVTLIVRAVLN